jgi:hypothetical protein
LIDNNLKRRYITSNDKYQIDSSEGTSIKAEKSILSRKNILDRHEHNNHWNVCVYTEEEIVDDNRSSGTMRIRYCLLFQFGTCSCELECVSINGRSDTYYIKMKSTNITTCESFIKDIDVVDRYISEISHNTLVTLDAKPIEHLKIVEQYRIINPMRDTPSLKGIEPSDLIMNSYRQMLHNPLKEFTTSPSESTWRVGIFPKGVHCMLIIVPNMIALIEVATNDTSIIAHGDFKRYSYSLIEGILHKNSNTFTVIDALQIQDVNITSHNHDTRILEADDLLRGEKVMDLLSDTLKILMMSWREIPPLNKLFYEAIAFMYHAFNEDDTAGLLFIALNDSYYNSRERLLYLTQPTYDLQIKWITNDSGDSIELYTEDSLVNTIPASEVNTTPLLTPSLSVLTFSPSFEFLSYSPKIVPNTTQYYNSLKNMLSIDILIGHASLQEYVDTFKQGISSNLSIEHSYSSEPSSYNVYHYVVLPNSITNPPPLYLHANLFTYIHTSSSLYNTFLKAFSSSVVNRLNTFIDLYTSSDMIGIVSESLNVNVYLVNSSDRRVEDKVVISRQCANIIVVHDNNEYKLLAQHNIHDRYVTYAFFQSSSAMKTLL